MAMIKGESKLPDELDNGLAEIPDAQLRRLGGSHGRIVTVTIWDVHMGGIDFDNGEQTWKLRVKSVEVMTDADRDQAVAMHDRIHGARTGEVTLGAAGTDAGDGNKTTSVSADDG